MSLNCRDKFHHYTNAKALGPAAMPFLMELVQGGDLGLASKATYLASLIKTEQSKLQQKAETDPEPFVRELAASTVQEMERKRQAP